MQIVYLIVENNNENTSKFMNESLRGFGLLKREYNCCRMFDSKLTILYSVFSYYFDQNVVYHTGFNLIENKL